MVGRESKGGLAFSWADEVEKEEAEAAAESGQAQVQQKQKPNPFGSARPREVVLQEKGIDWRKLDLHLQQSPPLRHESQKERLRKQRNPQTTTTILSSKQPQVISAPQIQSPILLVPPVRYPPKYVAGFLYEPWLFTTPKALDSVYKIDKENRSQGRGNFHNSKRESPTTELVQTKEEQQKGRILREAVVHGNKLEADSTTRKEKSHGRNSLGLPMDKRMPANGRQPRNIKDDLGMDGTAFQVTENNKAMEHKWQKVKSHGRNLLGLPMDSRMPTNGGQPRNTQDDLSMDGTAFQVTENKKAMEQKWRKVTRKRLQDFSVKKVNNGGRDKSHRTSKGRNNKKNFEKKEIKLHT